MLSLLRLSTSHFAIPTALLYGWLPLSSPAGASQASTGDVGVPGLSKTWAYQNGVHHIEHPISEISHKRLDNKKRGPNFRKQAFFIFVLFFCDSCRIAYPVSWRLPVLQKKRNKLSKASFLRLFLFFCDSCRIQTCNLLIRSQMLYSVELRSRHYVLQLEKALGGDSCRIIYPVGWHRPVLQKKIFKL